MAFTIRRGVNIGQWLGRGSGAGPATHFKQSEIQRIAEWGFDHVGLPIDQQAMWDPAGKMRAEAFDFLDEVLDWCEQSELRAVVQMRPLGTEAGPVACQFYAHAWKDLAFHMQNLPNDMVGYGVLASGPDCAATSDAVYTSLRELEPERMLIVDSVPDAGDTPGEATPNDRRLVLAFQIQSSLPPGEFGRATLEQQLGPALAIRQRTGRPVYCSALGCDGSREARLAWLGGIVPLLNEHKIGWSYCQHRGEQGLVDDTGQSTGIAQILLERAGVAATV